MSAAGAHFVIKYIAFACLFSVLYVLIYEVEELRGHAATPGGIAKEVVLAFDGHERHVNARVLHEGRRALGPGVGGVGVGGAVEEEHGAFGGGFFERGADR